MADDPYLVLGVDRSADIDQIRRAYLRRLRDHHPDLHPGDAGAQQQTADLNRAWEQIRTRAATNPAAPPPPSRVAPRPQRAYSTDQHQYRLAFTNAALRVALAMLAIGLVLVVILGR